MKAWLDEQLQLIRDSLPAERPDDLFQGIYYAYTLDIVEQLETLSTRHPEDSETLYMELKEFLAKNAAFNSNGCLSYSSCPNLPVTELCIHLAEELNKTEEHREALGLDDDIGALDLLLPGVWKDPSNMADYPELYPDSGVNLHDCVKKGIICPVAGGYYLAPVKALLVATGKDPLHPSFMNAYSSLDHQGVDGQLSPETTKRLIHHSETTEAFWQARSAYEEVTLSGGTLLAELNRLIGSLYTNSVDHKGSEEIAGKDIGRDLDNFFDFYRQLAGVEADVENHFPDVDGVPPAVSAELKILFDYHYGKRPPDIGSCLATRRTELMDAIRGQEEALVEVKLKGGEHETRLEQAKKTYEAARGELERTIGGPYQGQDKLPITLELMQKYQLTVNIGNFEDALQLLNSLTPESIQELLKPGDLRDQLVSCLKESNDLSILLVELPQHLHAPLLTALGTETIMDIFTDDEDLALPLSLVEMLPTEKRAIFLSHFDINARDEDGHTLLSHFTEHANIPMMEAVLAAGADVDRENGLGKLPLQVAVIKQNKEAIETLFRHGASVDKRDSDGSTALHEAVKKGDLPLVKYLLTERRASAEIQDNYGVTPFLDAAYEGEGEIIQVLCEHGADPKKLDSDGLNALMNAALLGHSHLIKPLLALSLDIDGQDHKGESALIRAINTKQAYFASELLTRGASPSQADDKGKTPLMYAALNGMTDTVVTLIKAGADIHATNRDKLTVMDMLPPNSHLLTVIDATAKAALKAGQAVHSSDERMLRDLGGTGHAAEFHSQESVTKVKKQAASENDKEEQPPEPEHRAPRV